MEKSELLKQVAEIARPKPKKWEKLIDKTNLSDHEKFEIKCAVLEEIINIK